MADFEPIPEEILQSRRSSREMADKSPSGSSGHHNKESSSGKSKSRHNKRSKSSSSGDGQHRNKSVGSKSSKSAVSSEPLINDLDPPPMMLASTSQESGQNRSSSSSSKQQQQLPPAEPLRNKQQHHISSSKVTNNPSSSADHHRPCDKHPPDYFARLLDVDQQPSQQHNIASNKQPGINSKAKLNQLWPRHWGSYNDQPERDSLDGNLPSSSFDPSKSKRHLNKEKEATGGFKEPTFINDPPALSARLAGSKSVFGGSSGAMASSKSVIAKSTAASISKWTGEREPFTHLWVSLSAMYGKFLVVLMLAFCFTEVMDNSIAPLTFQGVYMIFLYVGSIVAIMCIYISLLIDQCPSLTKSRENLTADPEIGSLGSTGGLDTLKRAHISRARTPRTSFYLRVGALVFGLATLIFNGLEIAMHATLEGKCVAEIVFAHPILQALFTFLQMHFLFVNSEVLVEKFGLLARFGFMHLIATNVSLWIRTVVWESANEWLHYLHHQHIHSGLHSAGSYSAIVASHQVGRPAVYQPAADYAYFDDEEFDSANTLDYASASIGGVSCNQTVELISQSHIRSMVSLYQCFNNNTLGKIWTSSMPHLFPFLVEYNLIAAAVAYIMWRSVGKLKKNGVFQSRLHKQLASVPDDINNTLDPHRPKGHWRVDCQGASKGLFLGLLSLVAGIIVLIIFFVMKDNVEFRPELFWLCTGTQVTILCLAVVFTAIGFVQLPKLSLSLHKPLHLDVLLANITTYGVFIYAIFGLIVGGTNLSDERHVMIFASNGLLLIQATLQGMFIAEASKRVCTSRYQMLFKPGRQIVTFLLFANITLWLLDTFMSHNWMTQELQFNFYGFLAWGIISRLSLPLLVFYRFHSAVVLIEIWKNTYRTKDV